MASTIVGLDIGSSGVRAAEFRLGRRGPSLRKFAGVPLPEGAVRAGVVVDTDAVTAALKELWKQGKFSTKSVAIGIANEGVFVRQMDLDWMPPADFRKALRYQVADALPVSVDEANLDYHLLEELEVPTERAGETRRVARVLLVSASREVVDSFVGAAHGAGLRVVRADLLPFALIRATAASSSAETEAIVDIGADNMTVAVHQGGQPRFVRMIPGLGAASITRDLQHRYDWSWEDAERTKVVLGLPAATLTDAVQDPSVLDHPAQQQIAQSVAELVGEVRTTLEFFLGAESARTEPLAKVRITGSGSRLNGLDQRMSEQLGVAVEPLSVIQDVRKRRGLKLSADEQDRLAVPAGLCLGRTA